jgi:hypothetical protein
LRSVKAAVGQKWVTPDECWALQWLAEAHKPVKMYGQMSEDEVADIYREAQQQPSEPRQLIAKPITVSDLQGLRVLKGEQQLYCQGRVKVVPFQLADDLLLPGDLLFAFSNKPIDLP